ncbi:MAG: hypothetical protein M3Y68_06090, partial [Chloroflexota bacterium]|nr:hypothetical protein [Chloroflexota bacterium]
ASNNRSRLLALGVFSLLSFVTLSILAMAPGAALWNLWTYHGLWWGDATLAEKIIAILVARPLSIVFGEVPYTFYFLLILLFSLLILRDAHLLARVRAYLLHRHEVLAMSAAILFFMLSHIPNGNWFFEYLVPGIYVSIMIFCIGCVKIYNSLHNQRSAQTLIAGVLGLSLVILPVQQSGQWLDIQNGEAVLTRVSRISDSISGFTQPGDPILTLEALWISIESGRDPLPGYSMAQFSYWPFEEQEEARHYKLVNLEILRQDILRGEARAVILSNVDWWLLGSEGAGMVCDALRQNYVLERTIYQSERHTNQVYIYRTRDRSSASQDAPPAPCAER